MFVLLLWNDRVLYIDVDTPRSPAVKRIKALHNLASGNIVSYVSSRVTGKIQVIPPPGTPDMCLISGAEKPPVYRQLGGTVVECIQAL
jgi:hypothetical protein